MKDRLDRCRKLMAEREVEVLLVTDIDNVRYLTGFTGSAGSCIITQEGGFFVTDGRYTLQAGEQVRDLEVRIDPRDPPPAPPVVAELLKSLGKRIGFESEHVTVAALGKLKEQAEKVEFVEVAGLVEDLRRVKDAGEIAIIRDAVRIVDETFSHILQAVRPGRTEREIALDLDFDLRGRGADKSAFDTIVASGPNSALPHARPTDRVVQAGDLVILDFGAAYRGYHSDLTRTLCVGEAGPDQRKIYDVVLTAQEKALQAIRPGLKGQEVDAIARDSITAAGYGDYFNHSLGHSLGLSVHDGPALAKTVDQPLDAGMVVTVEPGVYLEGVGGVRIEDDVLVTETGCEILTRSPKELLCV